MAQKNRNAETTDVRNLLLETADLIRGIVTQTVQQILDSEMEETLGAAKVSPIARLEFSPPWP